MSNQESPHQVPADPDADDADAFGASSPSSGAEEQRIILKTPPRVPPFFYGGLMLALVLVTSAVVPGLVQGGLLDALVILFFSIVVGSVLFVLLFTRAPSTPVIRLQGDRMVLPINVRGAGALSVRYRDVTTLFLRRSFRGFLWIGTSFGTFVYPLRAFRTQEDAERLVDWVEARVLAQAPDGDRRVAEFKLRGHQAETAFSRKLWVTSGTLGLLMLMALLQWFTGGFDRLFAAVDSGALSPLLVETRGQWFRVISAHVVHRDVFHLVMGGLLIAVEGSMVERLLGARATLVALGLGALLGSAAMMVSGQSELLMGSSTLVFALLGAFAFTSATYRGRMPLGFQLNMRLWMLMAVLIAVLVVLPEADFPAHLGAFLGGAIGTAIFISHDPPLPLMRPTGIGGWAVTGVVAVAWGVAVPLSVHNTLTANESAENEVIAQYIDLDRGGTHTFNQLAWEIALDLESSEARLLLAEKAAARAVSKSRIDQVTGAAEDTWATVLYRLGRHEDAVNTEIRALDKGQTRLMATQLARFMQAYIQENGPRPELAAGAVSVTGAWDDKKGCRFQLKISPDVKPPVTGYVQARKDGKFVGLVRVGFNPEAESNPEEGWLAEKGREPPCPIPPQSTLQVVWITEGAQNTRAWSTDVRAEAMFGPIDGPALNAPQN